MMNIARILLLILKHPTMKYGLGRVVKGEGGYGWGGADGTQFAIDRKNIFSVIFMVQTQGYRAPTYPAFLALANEAAAAAPFRQRDRNNDGKLDREELPRALYDRLDVNTDGFVTEDELKTLWQTR